MNTMVSTEIERPDIEAIQRDPRVPKPTGYKLLLAILRPAEKTAGGVIIPGAAVDREQTGSMVGYVCNMGPLAYEDHRKFPTGAWCKPGDFVTFHAYSGDRLEVDGIEFRLLNDDAVTAVVEDPSALKRK